MDVREILNQLGVAYAEPDGHHVRDGWLGIPNCPWCGSPDHLGLHVEKLYCSCWQCGHHRLGDTLAKISGRSVAECLGLIGDVPKTRPARVERTRGTLKIPKGVVPLLPQHRQYLTRRGLDPDEIAETWGVQGIGLEAKLRWRLFIPITWQHKPVSWTTRAIGDGAHTRYVNASPDEESMSPKDFLYGQDLAGHAIVVCEGPVDIWSIGPGAVATMGLLYTPRQVMRIARFPVRTICFDGQPAAQRRARKLAVELEGFPGVTNVIELETGKDANEADRDEIRELRKRYLEG
jgi:hypothetical protein